MAQDRRQPSLTWLCQNCKFQQNFASICGRIFAYGIGWGGGADKWIRQTWTVKNIFHETISQVLLTTSLDMVYQLSYTICLLSLVGWSSDFVRCLHQVTNIPKYFIELTVELIIFITSQVNKSRVEYLLSNTGVSSVELKSIKREAANTSSTRSNQVYCVSWKLSFLLTEATTLTTSLINFFNSTMQCWGWFPALKRQSKWLRH